jgi:hypothetical protein
MYFEARNHLQKLGPKSGCNLNKTVKVDIVHLAGSIGRMNYKWNKTTMNSSPMINNFKFTCYYLLLVDTQSCRNSKL